MWLAALSRRAGGIGARRFSTPSFRATIFVSPWILQHIGDSSSVSHRLAIQFQRHVHSNLHTVLSNQNHIRTYKFCSHASWVAHLLDSCLSDLLPPGLLPPWLSASWALPPSGRSCLSRGSRGVVTVWVVVGWRRDCLGRGLSVACL